MSPIPPLSTDRFADVGGLRLRYIEAGAGPAVIFLHGGSLGSSADVFRRNLPAFAAAGLRAIAFDQPGFGLSDVPANHSTAFRRDSVTGLMNAMALGRAALIAHSQSGGAAVQLALAEPQKFTHIVILSTGSLLPPAEADAATKGATKTPREWEAGTAEPSLTDTRQALEENVFNHALITDDELALRHRHSVGRNYAAFVARLADEAGTRSTGASKPLWQRLPELTMPLLMIYGRQDRARAAERAELLKRTYPVLDLKIVDRCKHMLPWDAAEELVRLAVPFLKR